MNEEKYREDGAVQEQNEIAAERVKPKKKGGVIVSICLVIVIALALMGIAFIWFMKPFQKFAEATLELGAPVPGEMADYVNYSDNWFVELLVGEAEVEISGIDSMKVGDYEAYLKHGLIDYTYIVHVEDTTAPILLVVDHLYLAINREVTSDMFVTEVSDLSGEVEVQVNKSDKYTPSTLGQEAISISAKDASGNETVLKVPCDIETPPYIVGANEGYIATGLTYDPLESVVAIDELDGVLTGAMSVDLGGL